MSAYQILDDLRDHGLKAPLQVYRALNVLQKCGLVHRLESQNAFVACCDDTCVSQAAFAICEQCADVIEFKSETIEQLMSALSHTKNFQTHQAVIELKGVCGDCLVTKNETGQGTGKKYGPDPLL